MNNIRKLAIAVLDDSNGINAKAYEILVKLLIESDNVDIISAIDSHDNRYFLNEDHELEG